MSQSDSCKRYLMLLCLYKTQLKTNQAQERETDVLTGESDALSELLSVIQY